MNNFDTTVKQFKFIKNKIETKIKILHLKY